MSYMWLLSGEEIFQSGSQPEILEWTLVQNKTLVGNLAQNLHKVCQLDSSAINVNFLALIIVLCLCKMLHLWSYGRAY